MGDPTKVGPPPYPQPHSPAGRGEPAYLALILLFIAAWVRLFPLLSGTWSNIDVVMGYTTYDSNRYVVLADSLVKGKGFTRPWEEGPVHLEVEKLKKQNGTWPAGDGDGHFPEGFRTPGYPIYLYLFGGHAGLANALLAQCLLSALCSLLAVRVCRNLGLSRRAAWCVGWLWALHPAMVTTDLLVLTESLFGMMGLLALGVALERRTTLNFAVAGLIIGLDGLVRPLGILYLPSLLILAPLPRRKYLTILITILLAVAPSLLWMKRNADAGYGFRVSTVSEINLYYYAAAFTISESRGDDWKRAWPARIRELSDRLEGKLAPGDDVHSKMRSEGAAIIKAHPKDAAKVFAKSQLKLMIDHSMDFAMGQYRGQFEGSGLFSDLLQGNINIRKIGVVQVLSLLWILLNLLITLFALLGLLRFARRRQWRLCLGCAIPVLLFSAATFPVGLERFRIPMMLFLFIPAATFLFPKKI